LGVERERPLEKDEGDVPNCVVSKREVIGENTIREIRETGC